MCVLIDLSNATHFRHECEMSHNNTVYKCGYASMQLSRSIGLSSMQQKELNVLFSHR